MSASYFLVFARHAIAFAYLHNLITKQVTAFAFNLPLFLKRNLPPATKFKATSVCIRVICNLLYHAATKYEVCASYFWMSARHAIAFAWLGEAFSNLLRVPASSFTVFTSRLCPSVMQVAASAAQPYIAATQVMDAEV
jgi:hypothetical protein